MIDIRPREERYSELGWIPASLSLSGVGAERLSWLREQLEGSETAVLYCTSGRRSEKTLAILGAEYPRPLAHLRGGVLGWSAAGLPTCGLVDVEPPDFLLSLEAPSQFRQALTSCFVAATMESTLSDDDADPMQTLRSCYEIEGVSWEDPSIDDLYYVIDRMALASRRLGGDLATIVENTNTMHEALERMSARINGA